jgi:hypothetical protein
MRRTIITLSLLALFEGVGLSWTSWAHAGCGGGGRTYHYNGCFGYYTDPPAPVCYAPPAAAPPAYAPQPAYYAPRPAYATPQAVTYAWPRRTAGVMPRR